MEIGKFYNIEFEHTETERHVKLLALPGYTSEGYDGFLFERDNGKKVFVREFAKIVEIEE